MQAHPSLSYYLAEYPLISFCQEISYLQFLQHVYTHTLEYAEMFPWLMARIRGFLA